jgi:phytoene/squalene synthetase
MTLLACATLVERGDPDRFLAAMAAPPEARQRLFPLYAFNLEIARAPLLTQEPLIAEMRLQWWRDALGEIAEGVQVRAHEVTVPLAAALRPEDALGLADLIEARRMDIAAEPWPDAAALLDYLDRTAGTLLWTAARSLDAGADEAAVRALGRAQGLANWMLAAPQLVALGREPFPDADPAALSALARAALAGLRPVPRNPALLAAWRARPLLRQAARHPEEIMRGGLGQSEFVRRGSLLLQSLNRRV